ncbi:hypothetical protein AOZ06_28170 [Kibdelosporangium phytohabitans]|uniref:Right handed beta helix domain-containing protein n=1 Tax=Kibdelosporangium phytohabitans TaxID=860235 RepID=A0A0N9HXX0_9PSEU|nr:hypothetical protein AOZ06_28170 [Kibdelosporangium phytohabitans]
MVTASVMMAAPANAGFVTYCEGEGGPVTLPTDLAVAPGKSCTLDRTVITGNVKVGEGANLIVKGGTINGAVEVASDGYFDATATRVDGDVTLAPGGFGLYLRNTGTAKVTVQPKTAAQSFVFVEGQSKIDGALSANAGEVKVVDSEVFGNVTTNGALYTDLTNAFVDGTVSVLNNSEGSVVCGGAVQGKATFAGNRGGVQLGPNGGLDSCASGGYFARDVNINNTTGKSSVDDTIINGKLELSANNPVAQLAANNRIRGGVVGESASPAAARGLAAAERQSAAEQKAADRAAAATSAAAAKGKARL